MLWIYEKNRKLLQNNWYFHVFLIFIVSVWRSVTSKIAIEIICTFYIFLTLIFDKLDNKSYETFERESLKQHLWN